jgi:hypothetical protein
MRKSALRRLTSRTLTLTSAMVALLLLGASVSTARDLQQSPAKQIPAAAPAAKLYGEFIKNASTSMCLDLPGVGPGINYGVHQWTCTHSDGDNQQFNFKITRTIGSTPYYEIRNNKSGQCLDLPNTGWVENGALVNMWNCAAAPAADNQEWMTYYPSGGDWFLLKNVANPGLCLDVPGVWQDGPRQGVRLQVWPCNVNDDHMWKRYNVWQ